MSAGASNQSRDALAFSIVTATFNAGELFDRTAASLASQTCRSFEWIVVDGASSDDTVQRIRAAGKLVSSWISEPDKGIADAWNKGIARAHGQYVLILNAGDTYDSGFLEGIIPHCDGQRVVCSHARLCGPDGAQLGVFRADPRKLRIAMHLPHNWCAVPKLFYSLVGPYKKMPLAMDFDWFHRYYKRYGVGGFSIVDQVLGTYYLGGASDQRYIQSFGANERILVDNGMHPMIARAYMLAYRIKHALKHRAIDVRRASVK
jgi:glycosyltransferase involved in cell wall biosynthesis